MTNKDAEVQEEISEYDSNARFNGLIAYGLIIAGVVAGFTVAIGVVWAMVTMKDAKDSMFEDHYQNILAVFFGGLIYGVFLFLILWFDAFSSQLTKIILFSIALYLYLGYRTLVGFIRLFNNKPYAEPDEEDS